MSANSSSRQRTRTVTTLVRKERNLTKKCSLPSKQTSPNLSILPKRAFLSAKTYLPTVHELLQQPRYFPKLTHKSWGLQAKMPPHSSSQQNANWKKRRKTFLQTRHSTHSTIHALFTEHSFPPQKNTFPHLILHE